MESRTVAETYSKSYTPHAICNCFQGRKTSFTEAISFLISSSSVPPCIKGGYNPVVADSLMITAYFQGRLWNARI